MVDPLSDQELTALFHKHLPHKPMPPDLADRLKQQVLAEVATALQALPRLEASRLPPEATPALHFVAEQPDDQELYDLFQKHMLRRSLAPALAVHLQQQVVAAVDTASPAVHTRPTTNPTQHIQNQPPIQSRGERWVAWLNRLHHLFAHPPALALGGIASVLVVMLVLISLSRTPGRPVPPPFRTLVPGGVTSAAPSAVPRQAQLTITSGQAIIQKPSGQTETVSAGPTIHALAPGDRLITGESTAHIEYFPGQSTTVEPGAEVELQEYAVEGATTRVALLVYSGKTSHEVNTPLAEADLFEIRTPAAVASAKYTKLTVEVLSETQTHLETAAGTAQVMTANEEVVIAAGQQMTATVNNPWLTAPMSVTATAIVVNPWAALTTLPPPTPTPSATAITLMHLSEPFRPTNTATPDEAEVDVPSLPAPRETAVSAPTATPANMPVQPTMMAILIVPTYVVILVPTATLTPLPDTPTVLPTSTMAIINTAEPPTVTPIPVTATPVDTTTPTYTPTQTTTPTSILVPTATRTPALAPTQTQTATPTYILVPTATKTPAPTYTPTQTAMPTNTPAVSPTATNTPVPSPTPTNTPESLPTATDTLVPSPAATDTPEPTAMPTDTPVPSPTGINTVAPLPTATDTPVSSPTATDTVAPLPTATDTPVPLPTATDTPEPTAIPTDMPADTPVPLPTATDTSEPTAMPTDTPVPSPTATDTVAPLPTATDTPVPSPTATDTPEPTATPTDTPLPL